MDQLFFVFAGIAVTAALLMITLGNAYISALSLLVVFLSLSSLYLLLGAPLVAIFQVTIYAGAILVLIVFVIMLLDQKGPEGVRKNLISKSVGGVLSVALIGLLSIAAKGVVDISTASKSPANFGSPAAIGDLLISKYILHFEVASVLLLVALIGAIYMAKRKL